VQSLNDINVLKTKYERDFERRQSSLLMKKEKLFKSKDLSKWELSAVDIN